MNELSLQATDSPQRMVGRQHERSELRTALQRLMAGFGGLVLISGEAGIGKTTLVEDLRQHADSLGVPVDFRACYEITETVPYGLWSDLGQSLRASEQASAGPHPGGSSPDTSLEGDAIYRAIANAIEARCENQPLLLILEDLHWADRASLSLLGVVARKTRSLPLLIIGTYRADELSNRHLLFQMIPSLIRDANAERMELSRLDRTAVSEFVALNYALGGDDQARLTEYLLAHAEGNPLFLGELLRALANEGVVTQTGDNRVLGSLDQIVIPSLVNQLIQNRLNRLSDETSRSLKIAAVIGQIVPYDLWRSVLQLDDESLTPIVREAIDSGFILQHSQGPNLEFTNALFREAIYDQLLIPERRILHRQVADVLLQLPEQDPDVVATHLLQAHDPRAVSWLVRAGERAQRNYALRMASERFQSALRLMEHSTPSGRHAWFVYRTARLLRFADPGRGIDHMDQAAIEAGQVGDRVLEGYAIADRGMMRCFVGDIRRGLADIKKGVDVLAHLADEGVRIDRDTALWTMDALSEEDQLAEVSSVRDGARYPIMLRWGALTSWTARSGHFREAREIGERLLHDYETEHRPDISPLAISAISLALGISYAQLGLPDQARRAFARARDLVSDVLVGQFAIMELVELRLRFAADDLEGRRSLAAVAESAWSRAADARPTGVPTRYALAHLYLIEGDWDDALWLARLEASRDFSLNHPHATTVLASLGLWTGDYVSAENRIREVFPLGATTEPGDCEFPAALDLQSIAIELQLEKSDLAGAQSWLNAQERWLSWSGATAHRAGTQLLWARFYRQQGDLTNAQMLATESMRLASDPRQQFVLLRAHRLLGEIFTDQDDLTIAAKHLDIALQWATSCEALFERALTLLALARLTVRSEDFQRAHNVLSDSRDILSRLNARPAMTRADTLAAIIASRLGIVADEAPGEPQAALPAGLTRREAEVLPLVAAGLSNRSVAASLGLSIRTVERHVSNIYFKIHAHNRVDATAFAIRSKLL